MRNLFNYICASIAVVMLLMGAVGCMTSQKAVDYLKKKKELDLICATEYPVKTEYIKGDSIIKTDTIYEGENIFIDTTINLISDTVTKVITKTLPGKTITKTVRIIDTIVKENTAAVSVWQNKTAEAYNIIANKEAFNEMQAVQIKGLKKERNKWRLYFFILLTVSGVWTFRKPLSKLI